MRHPFFKVLTVSLALSILFGCASNSKKVQKPTAPVVIKVAPTISPEDQAQYIAATEAVLNEEYESAKTSFLALIAKHPDLAGAYVNLGIIYQALEDIPEALASYEKALSINPSNEDALLQLALLHIERGRFQFAEEHLLKAEAVNKNNPLVQFNLGVLYELYLQDYDEAITHYERYVTLSQDEDVETVKRWIKLLERK